MKIQTERKQKREAAEDARRDRETARKIEMDEMEQKAKELQQRMFREGMEQKKKKEMNEIKRRRKINETEILRRKKQRQLKEETQAIFEMQQKKAIDSMNEMDRRDSDRKRMLA